MKACVRKSRLAWSPLIGEKKKRPNWPLKRRLFAMNFRNSISIMNLARLGLTLLCLSLCLSGCAKPCPAVRPSAPPTVLMQDVPEPKLGGKTNAELDEWGLRLREAMRLSNADKAELRKWAENYEPRPGPPAAGPR